jgi:hypothetical protein
MIIIREYEELKSTIISQLKEKYVVLIQKGKKFSHDDIFDINV